MQDDGVLIRRIREGDLRAFEELYRRYQRPIYQTALAITRDQQAAEEILQDCFVRAYGHLGRIDPSASLSPWLHRIAVNLSYNWSVRRRSRLVPLDDVWEHLLAAAGHEPEKQAERAELQETVRRAIDSLGFKHKVVIVLFYLQGFQLSEIAYILDCPEGTVKSRLHYACRRLREKLSREWLPEPRVGLEYL